jgi:hypothetical protein
VWLTALIVQALMTTAATLGLQVFFNGAWPARSRVERLEYRRLDNPVNLETAVQRPQKIAKPTKTGRKEQRLAHPNDGCVKAFKVFFSLRSFAAELLLFG